MTITEIAKEAHVSIATVDRVLHKRGRVSEETQKRILEIARRGNYHPNLFASNLRRGAQLKIGVLMVDYHTRVYWSLVEAGCRKAMEDMRNLPVSVEIRYFNPQVPGALLAAGRKFLSEGVDGLVFTPLIREDTRVLVEELGTRPFAFFDASYPYAKAVVDTTQDPYWAGMTAGKMMHLIAGTSEHVCVFYNKNSAHNTIGRLSGFLDFFHGARELVIDEAWDWKEQIREFLLCNPDMRGIFVLHSASKILVEVLEQMQFSPYPSIIGFDDIPINRTLLQEGKIDCIISQDPYGQGYRALRQLALFMTVGNNVSTSQRAPVTILLKENVATFPIEG